MSAFAGLGISRRANSTRLGSDFTLSAHGPFCIRWGRSAALRAVRAKIVGTPFSARAAVRVQGRTGGARQGGLRTVRRAAGEGRGLRAQSEKGVRSTERSGR